MNIMSGYKISDEDIDGVVRYMEHFHPDNANYSYCRAMLEAFQDKLILGLRKIALDKADDIEELYDSYEEYLKNA